MRSSGNLRQRRIPELLLFWEYLEFSIKFVRIVLIYFRIFAPLLNIGTTNS